MMQASEYQRSQHGFTLIELMIVVAVIAVIAAIALPSYQAQVRKARRSDAIAVLNDVSLREERWRASNSTYSATWADLGLPTLGPASTFYTFTITGNTATDYTVTATASGMQTGDKAEGTSCASLSITRNGTKAPAVCFSR